MINALEQKFIKQHHKHLLIQIICNIKTFLQTSLTLKNDDGNSDGVEIHIDPDVNNNIIVTPPEADQPVYFKERNNAEEAEQINT